MRNGGVRFYLVQQCHQERKENGEAAEESCLGGIDLPAGSTGTEKMPRLLLKGCGLCHLRCGDDQSLGLAVVLAGLMDEISSH